MELVSFSQQFIQYNITLYNQKKFGSGHGLTDILSYYLHGRIEENHYKSVRIATDLAEI
jgi:hypothetical protein